MPGTSSSRKTAKQPCIQPANSPLDRPAMDIPSSLPPMSPPAHSSRKRGRRVYRSCLDSAPSTPKKARAGSDVMGDSDREDMHDERESEDGDVSDDFEFDFEELTGVCTKAYLPAMSNL